MSEGSLQQRDAKNIVPWEKGSNYAISKPFIVSRNTLTFLGISKCKLSTPQLNTLMNICKALQKEQIFEESFPYQYHGEVEIPISLKLVSGCHDSEDVMPSIIDLMNVKIQYIYEFKGMAFGIANLISSVEYRDSTLFVTISGKALPWYLYCGKKVGYAKIEGNAFFKISTPREKVLYSHLMMFIDAKTNSGKREMSIQELRELLGYGKNVKFGRINARVIKPLINHLNKYGSCYVLRTHHLSAQGRNGRPAVESVIFELDGVQKQNNCYEDVIKLISICRTYWSQKSSDDKLMLTPNILNALGECIPAFYAKCERACIERKKSMEKERTNKDAFPYWRANLVAKILREDYGIDVFNK